ncbi:tetratricopeptide repeat protein [Myxococcus sp. CA056]|uniref:tetratricopeptide repeat protein n=1 Tax=Myxococcus sp. CA056 TaxID=2741740 RepID=UPI00157B8563|nr:tetratricopeptide repeat protein [Myxococcus sp. CA056]NTX10399.1 tetratricopeptide repeat protein [Myxococcus sp. CA056]
MSKSCLWGECLVVFVCVSVAMPLSAYGAEGEVQRQITEAIRLYEDLEYERALERLKHASRLPHGPDEAVSLSLLRGIVQADMGRWEAARKDFREALQRQLDIQLPLHVSPKVSREFETQRTKVRASVAGRRADSPTAPPASAVEVAPVDAKLPSKETEVAVTHLVPPSKEDGVPEAWAPGVVEEELARASQGVSVAGRRVPVVSWALLGAGVAAGGVGTVFGLSSRSQIDDARSAQLQEDLESHHSRAQSSAQTANILFGAATAAAVGALATWLLMDSSEATVAEGGAR